MPSMDIPLLHWVGNRREIDEHVTVLGSAQSWRNHFVPVLVWLERRENEHKLGNGKFI